MQLHAQKISMFDRRDEICQAVVALPEGALKNAGGVCVLDGESPRPTQCTVTGTWPDGSVKWLCVTTMVDLPGDAAADFELVLEADSVPAPAQPISFVSEDGGALKLSSGSLVVALAGAGSRRLFDSLSTDSMHLDAAELVGPAVTDGAGNTFVATVSSDGWRIVHDGPIRTVAACRGRHLRDGDDAGWLDFEAEVTVVSGKPWIELAYRIVNREKVDETALHRLAFEVRPRSETPTANRTALATSNYRSVIRTDAAGGALGQLIDAEHLLYTANEELPEVHYGTFWADLTVPGRGGVCVTMHQAYQNFPKAFAVDGGGIVAELVPADHEPVRFIRGVARTQRMLIHLHAADESLESLNARTEQYQMPDRPIAPHESFAASGALEDLWPERRVPKVERRLNDLADLRCRGYGMLNFGDGPDAGYTAQGRGHGQPVWTNMEYDFPHVAMLAFARTGYRRMLDYMLVSAEHLMDVDICHDSDDPLKQDAQLLHTARHATGGASPCHMWVEGLLDYWHATADRRAYEAAVGIGRCVLRHLQKPELRVPGESATRVTGWALRTLVALYRETHDESWLTEADFIVRQFVDWQKNLGALVSPYTSHANARVPFMMAVATCSIMRYHRVRPSETTRELILAVADDVIDHCLTEDGRFYYKELPGLQRAGAGFIVLEMLAYAYELSGEVKYLEAGLTTFDLEVSMPGAGHHREAKYVAGDAVIDPQGPGPKAFAVSFLPLTTFYVAGVEAGLL